MFGTYEDVPIVLEEWQVRHMRDYSLLRAREKAPQIGFSWISAAEAVWEAVMFEDSDSGFVSVDLREAQNKVVYARKLYDGLPLKFREWVPLVNDSMEELTFGSRARPTRLTSFPSSSGLRGRKMNVFLDEVDFYKDGGIDAYRAGLGRITRGGRLTMGSTVFGAGTKLDAVMHHNEDTRFSRAVFPWTVVQDPEHRENIALFRGELPEAEAAEEYDAVRGGGAEDTFSPDLIRFATQSPDWDASLEDWDPSGPAVLGVDLGKSRHPSIMYAMEKFGATWRTIFISEPKTPGGEGIGITGMEALLERTMSRLTSVMLVVDEAGLGQGLSEKMEAKFATRYIGMNSSKRPVNLPPMERKELVREVQRMMETSEVTIPQDRELMRQLRSTQVTDKTVVQPGDKRRTHYDRFWAFAYACYATHAKGHRVSVYARRGLMTVGG